MVSFSFGFHVPGCTSFVRFLVSRVGLSLLGAVVLSVRVGTSGVSPPSFPLLRDWFLASSVPVGVGSWDGAPFFLFLDSVLFN